MFPLINSIFGVIIIFMSLYLTSDNIVTLIYLLVITFYFISNRKIFHVDRYFIGVVLILVIFMLSCIMSENITISIKIFLIYTVYFMIKLMLDNFRNWQKIYILLIGCVSFVYVVATIFQYYRPDIITSINRIILSSEQYKDYATLLRNSVYAGITGQTSDNAFLISLSISVIYPLLLNSKDRKKMGIYLALFILSIFSIVLTGKRSLIFANIISIIIIYHLNGGNVKLLLYFFSTVVIVRLGYTWLYSDLETLQYIIFRTFQVDDFSSGRFVIYSDVKNMFFDNYIFGVGLGTIIHTYGYGAHNAFLQVFTETGVIGGLVFILFVLAVYYQGYKMVKKLTRERDTEILFLANSALYIQNIFIIYSFLGNTIVHYYQLYVYIIATSAINSIYIHSKWNDMQKYT